MGFVSMSGGLCRVSLDVRIEVDTGLIMMPGVLWTDLEVIPGQLACEAVVPLGPGGTNEDDIHPKLD